LLVLCHRNSVFTNKFYLSGKYSFRFRRNGAYARNVISYAVCVSAGNGNDGNTVVINSGGVTTGGTSNGGNNTHTVVGEEEAMTLYNNFLGFRLNAAQKNWLISNPVISSEIFNFFRYNGFGGLNMAWVKNIVIKMMQNPGVFTSIKPFIIERKINDQSLDTCTKGIMTKLKDLQGNDLSTIIARFDSPESVFNLNISQGSTTTSPGTIRLGETTVASPFNYNVTLNNNYFTNTGSTNLLKAQAIIHELMHALIFSIVDNSSNSSNDMNDFPVIWNAYVNHEFGDTSTEHHEFLANKYINIIGAMLQEYDTDIPVPSNQGPSQLYIDLAWIGLIKIPSSGPTPFDNILSPEDKARIYSRMQAELSRAPYNGVQPSSTNPCAN
jgi:hypothetical protein